MSTDKRNSKWPVIARVMRLDSTWLTLIVEKLRDNNNRELEYWRVEKPGGILIIVLQNNKILLPKPFYRPGVGRYTVDLCGGRRISSGRDLKKDAQAIVKRELQIAEPQPFISLKPLAATSLYIDSSFSSALLDVFVAELSPTVKVSNLYAEASYPATTKGVERLLGKIKCVQCRLALREWQADLSF